MSYEEVSNEEIIKKVKEVNESLEKGDVKEISSKIIDLNKFLFGKADYSNFKHIVEGGNLKGYVDSCVKMLGDPKKYDDIDSTVYGLKGIFNYPSIKEALGKKSIKEYLGGIIKTLENEITNIKLKTCAVLYEIPKDIYENPKEIISEESLDILKESLDDEHFIVGIGCGKVIANIANTKEGVPMLKNHMSEEELSEIIKRAKEIDKE